MKDFAEKLKEARKAAGMTQQGMADRMLIPKRTIQDWEGGQRTPPPYVQRFVLNELESMKKDGYHATLTFIDEVHNVPTGEE